MVHNGFPRRLHESFKGLVGGKLLVSWLLLSPGFNTPRTSIRVFFQDSMVPLRVLE